VKMADAVALLKPHGYPLQIKMQSQIIYSVWCDQDRRTKNTLLLQSH